MNALLEHRFPWVEGRIGAVGTPTEVMTVENSGSIDTGTAAMAREPGPDVDALDLQAASLGAYGALLKRVSDKPLTFRFAWRDVTFQALVSGRDDGLRLSIEADMADVPYSIEDIEARKDMLAVIDATGDDRLGRICVVQGHKIVLENEFELPENGGNTINSIIATLTIMVLRATPYLEAVSDYIKDVGLASPESERVFQAEQRQGRPGGK